MCNLVTKDSDLLIYLGRISKTLISDLILVFLPPSWFSFSLSLVYASALHLVSSLLIAASQSRFQSATRAKHHIKTERGEKVRRVREIVKAIEGAVESRGRFHTYAHRAQIIEHATTYLLLQDLQEHLGICVVDSCR